MNPADNMNEANTLTLPMTIIEQLRDSKITKTHAWDLRLRAALDLESLQNENTRLKMVLEGIKQRAMDHAAFDEEAYRRRNIEQLIKKGGDVFDWTMIAIVAHEGIGDK